MKRKRCYAGVVRQGLCTAMIAASLWLGAGAAAPAEPELISMFPFGGQQGAEFQATIRGRSLDHVSAVWFDCEHLSATILGVENDKAPDPVPAKKKSSPRAPIQLLALTVKVAPGAETGVHSLRLLSPRGLSNPLPVRVHAEAAMLEAPARHEPPEAAQPIPAFPMVVNGKIAGKGEVDYYAFQAQQGEKLRFDALTAGDGFDPSLSLYEPTGSWFRPERLTRLAFNDDPVSYPGASVHATLDYRFPRKGRYLVRVAGFLGEGGPDHAYQLSIRASAEEAARDLMQPAHQPPPTADVSWKERSWKRELKPDRLKVLWSRAVAPAAIPEIPVVRLDESSAEPVPVTIPALLEGTIDRPADIDRVKFRVKGGDRIALEVETPRNTVPVFNPYLRVVSTGGDEAFTNVHSTVNTCGDLILKQIHPKTVYSFPRDGEFILEIRDITHVYGDATFAYRVALRQQVPHLGEIDIAGEHVNLVAGEAGKLTIETDQEEGYDGYVALTVEGLPEGVRAVMATELEPKVPPPFNSGKAERFRPESQKATFLFLSDPATPATRRPVEVRIMAQPAVKGKLGRAILAKKMLFTVVEPEAAPR